MASEEDVDLIVSGTRGLGGFEHALLGSVAESIVGGARCPVLVVHENDVPMLDPPGRVLLPTDRSADTDHVADALEACFGTEKADGSPIELILAHADRIPPYLLPAMEGIIGVDPLPFSQVSSELSRMLAPTAAALEERGFTAKVVVQDGEPAESMVRLAGARAVDLVAMSTHGRAGVKRLLLGSTARRVVQHAPCPVLTVRQPAD
jgi:nucleotide-binding universal stress UspA family protein